MNDRPIKVGNPEGYDLWSSTYDRYPNPTVAMDERFFPQQWSHLRGKRVFEVGCGTGRHTAKIAALGNRVAGIDFSPGMLAIARERLRGFPGVDLLLGDFLACPARDTAAFDAVIASLVLEHIRELPVFFARARSLLREGAEAHVSEIHPARASQGILAHFKTAAGEQFDLDSVAHPDGAIEAAARETGFALIARRDAAGDEELASQNPRWIRYLGVPMIRMWNFQAI